MHFFDVMIPVGSSVIGHSLRELDLRNLCGVTVLRIVRKGAPINNPTATERFLASDVVVVSGTLEDIELFRIYVSNPAEQ